MKLTGNLFNHKQKKQNRGFTLVEMMVSVSIFVVVAMIASGAFITMAEAQRKAQAIKLVVDNVNFALDSIVTPMKTGKDYISDCGVDDDKAVSFVNDDGETVSYVFREVDGRGNLFEIDGAINCDSGGVPMVAQEEVIIDVNESRFEICPGCGAANNRLPWARIIIKGTAVNAQGNDIEFNLQTFISQRFRNLGI